MSNYYLVSTGMRCFPKAGKNYFPCIKIKCIRDKKGLSVTASQSRMNIKIVFGNSREEGDFCDVALACEDGG